MKHAREDYAPIQDPRGIIPEDEPVMLFRAQDKLAPHVLKHYALLLRAQATVVNTSMRDSLVEMASVVEKHAFEMTKWQQDKGYKIPDL